MRRALDEFGRSPLHYAACDGSVDRVTELIQSGEDVNLADKNKWTPLHFAAQASSEGVARLLVEAGACVDAEDSFGNTPLWKAVFNSRGVGAVIRVLRDAGSDPLKENNSGVSPLSLAYTIGNYDVAQFFSDLPAPERYGA